MSLVKEYGKLIYSGKVSLNGHTATYEVRGVSSPMIHIYNDFDYKVTQLPTTPVQAFAKTLLSELRKGGKP